MFLLFWLFLCGSNWNSQVKDCQLASVRSHFVKVARLQREFCTKDVFLLRFFRKMLRNFPDFLSLFSVGQKIFFAKFPPNFPPNFPAKNKKLKKKKTPASFCRSAGGTLWCVAPPSCSDEASGGDLDHRAHAAQQQQPRQWWWGRSSHTQPPENLWRLVQREMPWGAPRNHILEASRQGEGMCHFTSKPFESLSLFL